VQHRKETATFPHTICLLSGVQGDALTSSLSTVHDTTTRAIYGKPEATSQNAVTDGGLTTKIALSQNNGVIHSVYPGEAAAQRSNVGDSGQNFSVTSSHNVVSPGKAPPKSRRASAAPDNSNDIDISLMAMSRASIILSGLLGSKDLKVIAAAVTSESAFRAEQTATEKKKREWGHKLDDLQDGVMGGMFQRLVTEQTSILTRTVSSIVFSCFRPDSAFFVLTPHPSRYRI